MKEKRKKNPKQLCTATFRHYTKKLYGFNIPEHFLHNWPCLLPLTFFNISSLVTKWRINPFHLNGPQSNASQEKPNLWKFAHWWWNIFPKDTILPIQKLPYFFLVFNLKKWFGFHGINDFNGVPSSQVILQYQNSCAMVYGVSTIHMKYLSSMSLINLALQEVVEVSLCQMNQMNAPSLHLQVLSQIFPHMNLRFVVIMFLGNGCLVRRRFLPIAWV